MKKIISVSICGVLALLGACKKKESNPTTKDMLLAGKWQISASIATTNYMGRDTTLDYYSLTEDCSKDDFLLYAGDGTGTLDQGANRCSADSQITHFNWTLLNNDTKLVLIDSNPDTLDMEISSTQMKLKQTRLNTSGVPVYYQVTYKNIK